MRLTELQQRNPLVHIVLVCKTVSAFNKWLKYVKDATNEDELGLTVLTQERIVSGAPPTLRWFRNNEEWTTLRPLVRNVEMRTIPPTSNERNIWEFLLDAVAEKNARNVLAPENLLGSVKTSFNRGTNQDNVKRQVKVLNLALAMEGWSYLGVQNSLEICDWDFKSLTIPTNEDLNLTPEDSLPIFMEGLLGEEAQEHFQEKVFGSRSNLPFTQNLGPYSMRNFFENEEDCANDRPIRICEQLVAAEIKPDFDGLTGDDVEILLRARRLFSLQYLKGCLIG